MDPAQSLEVYMICIVELVRIFKIKRVCCSSRRLFWADNGALII